jgi:U4/U6 small nuclear ribonucleoprotein PRP31
MSGLADELLADLDGLSDNPDEYEEDEAPATSSSAANGKPAVADDAEMSDVEEGEGDEAAQGAVGSLVLEGGIKPAEELDVEDVQQMELGAIEDVTSIAKLHGGKRMTEILKVRLAA